MTYYQPTRLEAWTLFAIIALTLTAFFLGGCRENPEANVIRDTHRNAPVWIVDTVARAVPAPPAAEKISGTNGGAGAVEPNDIADSTKLVPVPPKATQAADGLLLPRDLIIWSHPTCEPCKRAKRAIESRYGVECHLRTNLPQRIAALETVPVFEFVCRNGTKLFIADWNVDRDFDVCVKKLMERIDRNMRANVAPVVTRIAGHRHHRDRDAVEVEPVEPAADQRVAAAGTVGTSSARVVVQQAIDLIRKHIGEGVPFGIVWDRNGRQQFELLRNQDFSLESVLGTSGKFTVSATGAKNLPVEEAWMRYEDVGDRYVLTFGTTFRKSQLNQAPTASAQPVGVVDPASLSILYSLGKALWGVFHPQADITLGGRVSITGVLTGNTLGIDFKDAPKLHFELLADFLFGVKRAELAADKCRVLFLPQNFWARWVPFVPKERTILIN